MSIPIEAQECANCLYARQSNKFRPNERGGNHLVYCHFSAPAHGHSAMSIGNPVSPVRADAWCGQWSLHPTFAELAHA